MGRFVLRRLLTIIPIMLIVSFLVFSTLYLAEGNPAQVIAGPDATPAEIQVVVDRYGLDRPFYYQYGLWLSRVVQGDLGNSIMTRRPVTAEISSRLLPTAQLALMAMTLSIVFGLAMGVLAATNHNGIFDYITMVFAFIGAAMPVFWLGLILIFFFAVDLGWFPTGGLGGFRYLVLPAIALSASQMAVIARMTRSSTLEVIRHDYVRTAQSKGLGRQAILYRHILRNAMIPVVTVIGLEFGNLLAGTVLTETVFSRPGLGRLLVEGIRSRDFPVVQGTVMFFALIFVGMNLIVDILYSYIDPRIRGVG